MDVGSCELGNYFLGCLSLLFSAVLRIQNGSHVHSFSKANIIRINLESSLRHHVACVHFTTRTRRTISGFIDHFSLVLSFLKAIFLNTEYHFVSIAAGSRTCYKSL